MQKANVEKQNLTILDQKVQDTRSRLTMLEDIVFQRDEFDRMAIFDKIFSAIRSVDK